MATKLYSFADLKKIVVWVKGKKLEDLLAERGITPVQEVRTAKRCYRVYDAAAMKKAKALRIEHYSPAAPDPAPEPAAAPAPTALSFTDIRQLKQLMVEVTGLRNLLAGQNNRMMEGFNQLADEIKRLHSDHSQIIDLLTQPKGDNVPTFDDTPSTPPQ